MDREKLKFIIIIIIIIIIKKLKFSILRLMIHTIHVLGKPPPALLPTFPFYSHVVM
jgi:hypothetical protein